MTPVLVDVRSVTKKYGGLRPLRIERLTIARAQQIALLGFDQVMAEVFVNLVTGSALPDTGEIDLFGRNTAAIQDSGEWLSLVDRFGIVSDRAVLLEGLSVVQNLAMPLSLDVDPLSSDLRESAIALGREVGLTEDAWQKPVGAIDAASELRVRFGRALALDPAILILEHATARLEPQTLREVGRSIGSVAERRGLAAVTITADRTFADAAAAEVLTLNPATGAFRGARRWWRT